MNIEAKDTASLRPAFGARILVIEDNAILANEICSLCVDMGAMPIGPVASVEDVAHALAAHDVDAATVDINLGDGCEHMVSDRLAEAGVPFIFVTSYSRDMVPERHATVPFVQKPAPIDYMQSLIMRAVTARRAFGGGSGAPQPA